MKKILLLSIFFAYSLNCMQPAYESDSPDHDLKLLAECDGQEEWQKMHVSTWNPWISNTCTIMDHYQATQFLSGINKKYEKIRMNGLSEHPKYTSKYFADKNVRYVNRLKSLIEKYGWPTEELFNAECALGASLIAQHCNDLKFQESCLSLLSNIPSQLGKQHYAYLSDLISVKNGKAQYFGTQTDRDGKLYPIQGYSLDLAHAAESELQLEVINQRRKAIGLNCLQDELERVTQFIRAQKLLCSSSMGLLETQSSQ